MFKSLKEKKRERDDFWENLKEMREKFPALFEKLVFQSMKRKYL